MNPDGSVRPDAEEPQKDVYRYASVIIDISHEKVDRPFQYRIPDALLGKITVGTCVQIPFGKGNRERSGYVVELTDSPVYAPDRIKEINLGGTKSGADRKAISKAVHLSDADIEKVKELVNDGKEVFVQMVPDDASVKVMNLL